VKALSNMYNFTESYELGDMALAIDPNDDDTLIAKGWTYYSHNQGNYAEAIKWYEKALEIKPNDADAYSAKGLLYYRQDNHTEELIQFMTRQQLFLPWWDESDRNMKILLP
jgi:tetratricopeptide (TPR) repeat protein